VNTTNAESSPTSRPRQPVTLGEPAMVLMRLSMMALLKLPTKILSIAIVPPLLSPAWLVP